MLSPGEAVAPFIFMKIYVFKILENQITYNIKVEYSVVIKYKRYIMTFIINGMKMDLFSKSGLRYKNNNKSLKAGGY